MKENEVILIIDNQVFRVSRKVWDTFRSCAGQMIKDKEMYDYYSFETKNHLKKVERFYRQTL